MQIDVVNVGATLVVNLLMLEKNGTDRRTECDTIRRDNDIFIVRSKAETVSLIYRTVP